MDRKLVAILVAGVIVMGATVAWRLHSSQSPDLPKSKRGYMHCPKCYKETRYNEQKCEEECPFCGQKGPMTATTESLRKTGLPTSPVGMLIPPLLLETTLLIAVVFLYLSRRAMRTVEEELLNTECKHCRQKLRYKAARAGQPGQCPRCKRMFLFPGLASDQVEAPLRSQRLEWLRPGRWWEKFTKTS